MKLAAVILFGSYHLVCPDYAKNQSDNYITQSVFSATNTSDADLPSPELVDAIHKASTCQVVTPARDPKNEESAYKQNLKAKNEVSQCKDKTLISGHYKDIVNVDGVYGLYGWFSGPNGKRIQPFYSGHSIDYKDYSQAARYVYPKKFSLDDREAVHKVIGEMTKGRLKRFCRRGWLP